MSKTGAYKIEDELHSRGGWVFYIEQGRLPFSWEILGVKGRGVDIPTPEAWNDYCEKHSANWAKGRRQEIVQRVAEGLLKKWYGDGTYKVIEDRWLNIYPGPSLLSRLLDKLG
jgi:hypothetical protein